MAHPLVIWFPVSPGYPVIYNRLHPDVVSSYLTKEIALGRIAGPFQSPPLPNLQCHPMGVIPKKHPNEWQTFYHLSYPEGNRVKSIMSPIVIT